MTALSYSVDGPENASVVVLSNSLGAPPRHLVNLEQPTAVSGLLLGHLDSAGAAR